MKSITITPTEEFAMVGDKLARKWNGVSDQGVPCRVYTVSVTCEMENLEHFKEGGLSRIPDQVTPVTIGSIAPFDGEVLILGDKKDDEPGKGMGDGD